MGNVAAEVRRHKEQHPELYCHVARCLWRTVTARGASPCRNHPIRPAAKKDEPPPAPVATINLEAYVREALDGVTGDIELPTRFTFAEFGAPRAEGLTDEQRLVYRAIEAALIGRFRPLTTSEQTRLGMALVMEWNRRAAVEAERASAAVSFTATDGRYFASDADRRTYQRTLDERAARRAARQARVELRQQGGL